MNRRSVLKILGLTGIALGGGLTATRAFGGNPYYGGPPSDHFDGRLFFNPAGDEPSGFSDLLRWKLGGGRADWPSRWPQPALTPPDTPERLTGNALRVTMIGHATLLIQVSGVNILTDPVFSQRASPFGFAGPHRVSDPGIAFDDLPPIHLVLLSHNHYDHMDLDTLARLAHRDDPVVCTPLGNDTIIRERAPGMRIVAQDWGDVHAIGPLRIHCEPTHHWSARGVTDRRMALWSSFMIEGPAGRIYHVGDTGFAGGRNYRDARARHGPVRLALLPIGAYEPRWFMRPVHQNPEEAVVGFTLLDAAYAVGHHWATFQLTDEAITDPRDSLHAALDAQGIARARFRPLVAGESFDVPG
ncbi:MBL fold metallo-hydrolase [Fulvimarina sp. 2208YS6-2-32]|uniref:MBL fold metallo-hydrolase n=1 Tax=Fulvimarina uroteuthidis TaxID=3098149 RepID=A0ABU5I217_9HYPH|nr:MBL fold metallo-hydrolase [Fulvimarina sp. 2208YS6-2-32]MDY8109271.1 MBL fold metallo-hydrolase [Fulvimarina sp. 2208YS6-2-32]